MRNKQFFVYLLTNKLNTVIYIGVTNNLTKRIWAHKNKFVSSFTSKYRLNKLVYFEIYEDPKSAIEREKQLKAGSRKKKEDLINRDNPEWKDLYDDIL